MAKDIVNLYAESDRNILSDDPNQALILENNGASTGKALSLSVVATAAPTIAVLSATNSVASGAFFEFKGMLASLSSVAGTARGIRVKYGDSYGWIPIYSTGTFT